MCMDNVRCGGVCGGVRGRNYLCSVQFMVKGNMFSATPTHYSIRQCVGNEIVRFGIEHSTRDLTITAYDLIENNIDRFWILWAKPHVADGNRGNAGVGVILGKWSPKLSKFPLILDVRATLPKCGDSGNRGHLSEE